MSLLQLVERCRKLVLTLVFWPFPFYIVWSLAHNYQLVVLQPLEDTIALSRLGFIVDLLALGVLLFLLEIHKVQEIVFGGKKLVIVFKVVSIMYVIAGPVAQFVALKFFR